MRIFEGRREGVVGGRIWADWLGALLREEFEGMGFPGGEYLLLSSIDFSFGMLFVGYFSIDVQTFSRCCSISITFPGTKFLYSRFIDLKDIPFA